MEQKGRSVHVLGVRNGRAKLNAESAAAIADLLSQGRLPREVAAQFGVHRTTVSNIGRGKTWSHITGIGAVS
jgi:DNA invertase Pin-like site-specific DNA recombinase